VFALSGHWCEEKKNKIDRHIIYRTEMDRPIETHEDAEKVIKTLDTGMRQGKAVAKPGRTELLAGLEGVEDRFRFEIEGSRCARGEVAKQLLFAFRTGAENNVFGRHKVREIHCYSPAGITSLMPRIFRTLGNRKGFGLITPRPLD
jgi:hypothetical protein